jgi:hypothetical protein
MATRYFTKSCLNLALSCPRKLLYTGKPQYANVNDGNELLKILADGGFQVGELAKLMYPSGVEIATKNSEEALVKTAELLRQDSIVLFAPAIAYKDCLVRVDVLVKSGHVFQVIEVTAKSYPGDQSIPSAKIKFERDIRQYVKNVAFQKFVVEKAFPAYKVSAYLLMPDKSKHANVNGMNQLFKVRHSGSSIEVLVDPRALVPGLAESVLTCVDIDPLVNAVLDKQMTFPGGKACSRNWLRDGRMPINVMKGYLPTLVVTVRDVSSKQNWGQPCVVVTGSAGSKLMVGLNRTLSRERCWTSGISRAKAN